MNDPRQSKFPQVYTVEASAGSGKTYCLATRYVELLTSPHLKPQEFPLKAILAITFTNKAAIEMKERVLEFLKKLALGNSKKASQAMDYLLKNYNFFQVQTIDSFINSILYGCAYRLGLSANFKTKEDYYDYLAYSLDRLIDKAAYDSKVLGLFRNFLKQYIYIENKTGWFPKKNIITRMDSLFSKSNKYAAPFVRNDVSSKDVVLCKNDILKLCRELKDILPDGTHAAFVKSLSSFLDKDSNGFGIDAIPAFFKREDFPANKGVHAPVEVKKLWAGLRRDIKEFAELESFSAFNYYIDIFNEVVNILKDISGREDVLFLDSLNKNARKLFDANAIGLPELYYRLATRFRHFLIDEFQDTSRLQWENIFLMVEEALSTGGSLFYVGDSKQAIYRFRAGDASLMHSVKGHFRDFNLIEESLTKNYRSRRNIVEFNNSVFCEDNLNRFMGLVKDDKKTPIELSADDLKDVFKNFKGAIQEYMPDKTGGYVRVEPVESEEHLKTILIDTLKGLKKRRSFADIAILTRKNEDVELFTWWLLENDIPVESEKTLNIKENRYIKELVSLLKFLNSPIDNISFASFVSGDIFRRAAGMNFEALQDFIFSLKIRDSKENVYLYKEFRAQFSGIWERFFEGFFKSVGFVPLYELLVSIYAKFAVMDNFGEYQGFFMKFLELVKEEQDEYIGISGFIDFFDECNQEKLYVNVTKSDSVKVLTVHKAKGLEFGVVIIPYLQMNPKVDNEVVVESGSALSLLRMKIRYADFSHYLRDIYKEEYKKSFTDELNNMYVALTRASDELYVYIPPKAQASFNMARLLFPQEKIRIGENTAPPPRQKTNPVIDIPFSIYQDLIGLLKSEFGEEDILLSRQKAFDGEVMHRILSFVGNLYNQDRALILKQAVDKASFEFSFVKDFKTYAAIISKLLEDEKLKKYFYVKDAQVYLEKEIVNSYGDTKRLDRLLVAPKEVVIIDYKSSGEEKSKEKHHCQVREYMGIVRQIYPGRNVKGVLIYLDELKAEEVFSTSLRGAKSPKGTSDEAIS